MRDAQRFDRRADQRVVRGDPHLAAVVFLGRVVESVAFGRLHGEGLDQLDAAQRFGERFVDRRSSCMARRCVRLSALPSQWIE